MTDMAGVTVIRSRANPLFKRLRMLADSAQRQRREGLAILEGAHLVHAYLISRPTLSEVECCVLAENHVDANTPGRGDSHQPLPSGRGAAGVGSELDAEVGALVARIQQIDPRLVTVLDKALFDQISPVSNGGIGLMMLVKVPAVQAPAHVGEDCIILDGVQDAGNAGSMLRSAAAAGIKRAFCMPGSANAWSAKVLRAAMGAHFEMEIVEHMDAAELIARLAVPIAITDSHGTASLYQADLNAPLAWVFGNEGAGVSQAWRDAATHRLTIPQPGRIESLNVAAAAAVCVFEQCRQRQLSY